MECPQCKCDNREGAKFCNECGNKLEIPCPKCQTLNRLGAKFCDECGQKLFLPSEPPAKDLTFDEKLDKIQRYLPKGLTDKILSQRDRIEGERKQVTVMFCDMEGFTSLSERIGAEEAYAIMDQVYEILIHKVHDFEGTVNEMTGDGIVALFGAPIALEDAPQRAIHSALAIHREMVRFSDQIKAEKQILPIRMRIGIHTGPVVVGTVGNDLRVEFKAVGDTVNLASRIEGLAEPGTTYVTEDTFKLTEGLFRFEGLGDQEIKGKHQPVKVYRVLASSTRRTRFDVSAESGLTPYVGRSRELELLLDGFERAKSRRGQAFSIVADAGLGKSRLLYEFRKAISNENVTFLEGKCLSYGRDTAYHPITDILKNIFNILENDSDSVIRDKIKDGLHNLNISESSTLSCFLELQSVKDSGIDEISLSPEAKKARIVESFQQIILKISEQRPLIIAIEDLHWIDKSSEDTLKHLMGGIPVAGVLLILTYRTEFIHTWGGRSYHNQLNLNRLSNRESLTILSYLFGTEYIDQELENLVLEKTEGVPFYLEEFVKSLKDLEVVGKRDAKYFLKEGSNALSIPSTIQDVIMARVDSLSEDAKVILQAGSVIGREFDHGLLKEIIEFQDQDILSLLSSLKDSELIYERGIYPFSTYVFKHALTQETVYQSLLKRNRQSYHQKTAEVLESIFSNIGDTHPETLGHHYTEAGLSEKAIPYWQKAGETAIRRSANNEAVDHILKGLDLLKTLPETHDKLVLELNLLVTIGPPLMSIKGQPAKEVEEIYLKALELCEKVADKEKAIALLIGLSGCYSTRADWSTALEYSRQLLDLVPEMQDDSHRMGAHRAHGSIVFWLGKLQEANTHYEQAINLYNPNQHKIQPIVHYGDPIIYAFSFGAISLWLLGYPEKACNRSKESLKLAHRLNHAFSLEVASCCTAWLHSLDRNIFRWRKYAEMAIGVAKEYGLQLWLPLAEFYWELSMADENCEMAQMEKLHHYMDRFFSYGAKQLRPFFLTQLSELYRKRGEIEKGYSLLMDAYNLSTETGEGWWKPEVRRQKGEFALSPSLKQNIDPEICFQEALDVARQQEARSLELRAAMSMSRLWQSQGKTDEARKLLSDTYNWFTEGFDTPDLKDAKALLDEL